MPVFIWIGRDGEDRAALRKEVRPAHLEHVQQIERVRYAGPLLDEDGTPRGSVIVFDAPDLAAARAVAEGDPYARNGVFERVEVFASIQVLPAEG